MKKIRSPFGIPMLDRVGLYRRRGMEDYLVRASIAVPWTICWQVTPVAAPRMPGVNYIHTFNPTTVNEFRAGLSRYFVSYASSDHGKNLTDEYGISNVNVNKETTGLPWLDFYATSPSWTGTSAAEPYLTGYTVYQFADNLSHVQGKHSIKVGADIRRRMNNGVSNYFGKGVYFFEPVFTTNAFGNFLTGRALNIQQYLTPGTVGYRALDYGFYVQDDIKITPRLTLNVGMRYELFPGYVEAHNRMSNLDPATGIVELAGVNGAPRHFVPNDYRDFSPRFGFAWMPFANGKTVVRGGYGISYFNSGNFTSLSGLNPPYTEAFTVPLNACVSASCPYGFLDAQYKLSDGLPVQLRATPATFNIKDPIGTWRQQDPRERTPYTQYWSFGIQRALFWDTVLDVSYVGERGVKLPGKNEGNPTPAGDPSTTTQRELHYATIPNVSSITLYQNIYNSIYHSLQVKATKRFSHGMQFLGTYTYGRSIDDKSGSATTGGGDSNPSSKPEDPFDIMEDRGRSSFDQTQRFTLAYNYDLPLGRGRKLGSNWRPALDAFLGGWQVNGIFTFATGLPFSVFATASSGAQLGGTVGEQRANRILKNANLPKAQRSINGWFNKAAFADPLPTIVSNGQVVQLGQYGNSGRNMIDGPGMKNADFSLFKKFDIREKLQLQVRGEFFNIANNVNFYYPTSVANATDTTGGLITQAHPPRITQLALKLVF